MLNSTLGGCIPKPLSLNDRIGRDGLLTNPHSPRHLMWETHKDRKRRVVDAESERVLLRGRCW